MVASMMPLPHFMTRQPGVGPPGGEHGSVPTGSMSHSSTPAWTLPSPQIAFMQSTHASVLIELASSHCSPGSTRPLPRSPLSPSPSPPPANVQVAEQPSAFIVLPSSHASPGSSWPLPQPSERQVLEQPSPFIVLPSSHCSTPICTKLSPHLAVLH